MQISNENATYCIFIPRLLPWMPKSTRILAGFILNDFAGTA